MSHIECYKNHGIDYLRISEAVYVPELKKQKKHTIKNIGPLSNYDDGKPDFLKRFRKKWKEGKLNFDGLTYSTKSPTRNVFEFDNNQNYIELKNIGYFFPQNIYEKLGIDDVLRKIKSDSRIEYDLNGITKMLVFGRILDPASKKKTFENRNKYLFPVTTCDDLNDVYKALDVLAENSKKIQNRMNTKIKNSSIGRVTNLTYYDVTNYFFETMYGDDDIYELDENNEIIKGEDGKPIIVKKGFRKKGVSKENRNEPIVQMGLFIDNNGIPVSHKLFPGNTQDKNTFKDVLENDVDEMDLGRIVVVADNGMNTQENKYLITGKSNGYIVSKSVKKSWTKIGPWAMDNEGYTEIRNSSGEIVFKYKSRINEIELTYKNLVQNLKKQLRKKKLFIGVKNIMKEKNNKIRNL